MNYRDYKIFVPDHYYHIFNRGVGKMDIFKDDNDYRFFLFRLKENLFPEKMVPFRGRLPEGDHQGDKKKSHTPYIRKTLPANAFDLLCYCLIPNHFHFLIRQNTELAVSKLLSKICTSYSKYYNKKYDRVGSLLQDSFKAILVESDAYLLWLSSYIHNNPKTARLVKRSEDWQYGSYLDYIGKRQGSLVKKELILGAVDHDPKKYEKFVVESSDRIRERKEFEKFLLD